MSRVTNASFEIGTSPDDTLLNEKFSDIVTLTTGAVDDANVAEEGLDIEQLKYDRRELSDAMRLVYLAKQATNVVPGAGTAYPNTATRTVTEIAHGSGTRLVTGASGKVLKNGDILEVHFSVLIDLCTAIDNFQAGLNELFRNSPCWLVWLQWDQTSNALANWVSPPKQGDFNTNYGVESSAPYTIRGSTVTVVGGTGGTAATMPLQHLSYFYDGAIVDNTKNPPSAAYNVPPEGLQQMRSYFYKNETGNDITIYGFRLVIDGLYYPWRTAGNANNRFVHIEIDPAGALGQSVTLSQCYIAAKMQRGV
jgi:hypothetical protein